MTKSDKKIPMVAISRFMQPPRLQDQVCINFRGEEIRYSFISHLVAAFKLHGINFFIDKDEQKGKDLKHLFKRIKESQIALAIFSERYAQSRWCLNELAKMKKLASKGKLNVVPIFYKVKVNDVRHQEGKFGSNFWKLAKTSSGEEIKKWKEALEFFSNKMGLTFCGKSSEADFVKEIVAELERVQRRIPTEERKDHTVDAEFGTVGCWELGNCIGSHQTNKLLTWIWELTWQSWRGWCDVPKKEDDLV